ncbi:MAG: hypothetical protein HXY20_10295 [Acidobacteria bacterium]|nr:hypothetical protein [Acidobacteriota bacterium]
MTLIVFVFSNAFNHKMTAALGWGDSIIIMRALPAGSESSVQGSRCPAVWWHLPSGMEIQSGIFGEFLWLSHVVALYVRITGDVDVLNAEVLFLNDPPLADDQNEIFSTPEAAIERATLFDHCRRTVARGLAAGLHALPLIGTGERIDSLPRSWACLSGAADTDRSARAMKSVWRHLVREDKGLVLLFAPPFDRMEPLVHPGKPEQDT